jgi:hypothetical protein
MTSKSERLTVVATGSVAPYAKGEVVETIGASKRAVAAAIAAGHIVRDAEGNRVSVDGGEIVRWEDRAAKRVTFDDACAEIPATAEGQAWLERANEIMAMPDSQDTVGLWDEHSLELGRIGGRWV